MKNFLIKILGFLLLFIALNAMYLLLVRNLDWNFKKVLEARNLENTSFDILVIGNSLAMDGINTAMLGNAYNLAIGGATLKTNEFQLRTYLEKADKPPNYVVLGMASCIDENYKRETLHPIIRHVTSRKFDSYLDLPLFQFRWMASELVKKLVSKDHRRAHLVQGQLRIDRVVNDESNYPEQVDEVFNESRYNEIFRLSSIAKLCAEYNIELIIVEMPGVKSSQNDIPVGPHQIDKVNLFNFNNRTFCKRFDSSKHWLGGSHLNASGAVVFTKELSQIFK